MVRDRLGRRQAHVRSSTGKRVSLTDRDLIWLQKLARHGPLPTSYLLAFTAGLRANEKRAKERLGYLFHETNTPHQGAYLERPPQQFATLKAGYNQIVHAVSRSGRKMLREVGLENARTPQHGPWLHRHMVASATASIELAAQASDEVSFIPQAAILERAGTELRIALPFVDPTTGSETTKDLVPDALFGLEYHGKTGSKFRFFVVEADRGTEPVTSRSWNRKSFVRHLLQYHTYIAKGRYQDHLHLKAPLLVLNVVPEDARVELMRRQTERQLGSCRYQLFQTFPEFAAPWRPPRPNSALLHQPWQRVGHPALLINRAV